MGSAVLIRVSGIPCVSCLYNQLPTGACYVGIGWLGFLLCNPILCTNKHYYLEMWESNMLAAVNKAVMTDEALDEDHAKVSMDAQLLCSMEHSQRLTAPHTNQMSGSKSPTWRKMSVTSHQEKVSHYCYIYAV